MEFEVVGQRPLCFGVGQLDFADQRHVAGGGDDGRLGEFDRERCFEFGQGRFEAVEDRAGAQAERSRDRDAGHPVDVEAELLQVDDLADRLVDR